MLRQKRPGSWLRPGLRTEQLKKSRSPRTPRAEGAGKQRLPTCFPLRSPEMRATSSSRCHCRSCACPRNAQALVEGSSFEKAGRSWALQPGARAQEAGWRSRCASGWALALFAVTHGLASKLLAVRAHLELWLLPSGHCPAPRPCSPDLGSVVGFFVGLPGRLQRVVPQEHSAPFCALFWSDTCVLAAAADLGPLCHRNPHS